VGAADQRQPAAPSPGLRPLDRIEFDNAPSKLVEYQLILQGKLSTVNVDIKKATTRYLGWLWAIPEAA
jgi:hypothetical protein